MRWTTRRPVGYLLKDRVADVGEFIEALSRVAAGGIALDPEVELGLAPSDADHRRVLAVLRYLES